VDIVVTRCRDSETDEKRVATEIYDAGNARQRDGDAKRTVGRSSLSPFFCICGAACTAHKAAVYVPSFFFTLFFTKSKLNCWA
jgi:hypothetical protein